MSFIDINFIKKKRSGFKVFKDLGNDNFTFIFQNEDLFNPHLLNKNKIYNEKDFRSNKSLYPIPILPKINYGNKIIGSYNPGFHYFIDKEDAEIAQQEWKDKIKEPLIIYSVEMKDISFTGIFEINGNQLEVGISKQMRIL